MHATGSRPAEHSRDQRGRLLVGEMASVAQVACHEVSRASRLTLQKHVVIELDSKHIHIRHRVGVCVVPRAKVGKVSHRSKRLSPPIASLDAEAIGRAIVVRQRHGLDPDSARS
jgi:hypothetical protein